MKWDIDQLKFYSGITESKSSAPKKTEPEVVILKEGARLVGKVASEDGRTVAKIYRDTEWEEYFVRFEHEGKQLFRNEESDGLSYTDSFEDGEGIAKEFIDRVNDGDTSFLDNELHESKSVWELSKKQLTSNISATEDNMSRLSKDSTSYKDHAAKLATYKDALAKKGGKVNEGHSVLPHSEESDPESLRYQGPIPGLEGPFRKKTKSGDYVTVYYDPKEGRYYNRTSDMYYSNDEASSLFEAMEVSPTSHSYQLDRLTNGISNLSSDELQKKILATRTLLNDETEFLNNFDPTVVPLLNDLLVHLTKELQKRGTNTNSVTEKKEEKVSLLDDGKENIDNKSKTDDRMGKTQDDETSVKVPAGVVAQIDKRIKEIEKSKDEFDKTKYMEQDSVKDKTIDCLNHFKELLSSCTVGRHKEANVYYAGLMSPIQHLLPAPLVKFLHSAEEKYKPMDTSVYPQKPKSKDKPD